MADKTWTKNKNNTIITKPKQQKTQKKNIQTHKSMKKKNIYIVKKTNV